MQQKSGHCSLSLTKELGKASNILKDKHEFLVLINFSEDDLNLWLFLLMLNFRLIPNMVSKRRII